MTADTTSAPGQDDEALFISAPKAARLLGMDVLSVKKAVQRGEIAGFKVGARWRVSLAWIRAQARGDAGEGAA
jgi:hypothetical protein